MADPRISSDAAVLAASSLSGAKGAPGLIVVFVILHEAGYGVTSITRLLINADFLGCKDFDTISGTLAVPFMLGIAISPTLDAIVWEYGGYDLVIKLAILAALIGLFALIVAGKSAKQI
jgi:predicted MFS family arabinose efflux permease